MGNNQEGASACLALGVLQCGELWAKEEVARLLQAKLRPGREPLCVLPHICQNSSRGQPVLKGNKK